VNAQIRLSGQTRKTIASQVVLETKLGEIPTKKLLLIGTLVSLLVTARAATDEDVNCWRTAIPVIASEQPARYTVSGELCATAKERTNGTTVQLLVHGSTYNYDYWDFDAIDGFRYSYARDAAAEGFPTFAFDALGSGSSSRPPSDQLTIQAAAYIAHQIVEALRSGSIGGVQFGKVIIMGHSLGGSGANSRIQTVSGESVCILVPCS